VDARALRTVDGTARGRGAGVRRGAWPPSAAAPSAGPARRHGAPRWLASDCASAGACLAHLVCSVRIWLAGSSAAMQSAPMGYSTCVTEGSAAGAGRGRGRGAGRQAARAAAAAAREAAPNAALLSSACWQDQTRRPQGPAREWNPLTPPPHPPGSSTTDAPSLPAASSARCLSALQLGCAATTGIFSNPARIRSARMICRFSRLKRRLPGLLHSKALSWGVERLMAARRAAMMARPPPGRTSSNSWIGSFGKSRGGSDCGARGWGSRRGGAGQRGDQDRAACAAGGGKGAPLGPTPLRMGRAHGTQAASARLPWPPCRARGPAWRLRCAVLCGRRCRPRPCLPHDHCGAPQARPPGRPPTHARPGPPHAPPACERPRSR
jgi:hypothetical protein